MQYQVPQFIEVEDKVIGPLTLRQFVMLLIPGGVVFVLWFLLEFFLWLIITIFLGGFAAAVAFLKIGDQPFYRVALAFFGYALKPHLYLWKQVPLRVAKTAAPATADEAEGGTLRKLAGKINIFHN